jgi:hypothetical protein
MPNDVHPLRLDRSRYHSSEHGDHPNRARFWQDGLPFDAHGHLCAELCSGEQLAQANAKAPRRLDWPENPPSERESEADPRDPLLRDGAVNLELWAKGEARYVPAKVFAAIRERYNKSVTTFADAIEFLVNDAKLIPASQASKQLLAGGGAAPVKEEA